MENKRIVVLSGSFNPVTNAHVDVLSQAVAAVNAEKGLFVCTADANLIRKTVAKAKTRTSFRLSQDLRQETLASISQVDPRLGFGGAEDANPVGTTARLLKRLMKEYPAYEIYYICGADKLDEIPRWNGIDKILESVYMLVFQRNDINVGERLATEFWQKHRDHLIVKELDGNSGEISSTEVRRRFMAGEDYRALIPAPVYDILCRYTPADFPPLTTEQIIEATMLYDGRFGPSTARGLVYKDNLKRFHAWDVALLGKRDAHLAAKIYRHEFKVDVEGKYDTITDCVNADCVDVAEQMIGEGFSPAILNLASDIHPCGGYHAGSRAQEESLCYTSTLSQTLYQFGNAQEKCVRDAGVEHIEDAYPLEHDYGGIYAPCVRFFREGETGYYRLRAHLFDCAVVTVASLKNRAKESPDTAENAFFALDGRMTAEGLAIEKNKIRTIFRIALDNGHDSMVLGAFGCGAYHLLPEEVSALFAEVLDENEFCGKFKKLVFAIYEGKGSKRKPVGRDGKFAPFYARFGN